jgi:hypothetical protein
MQCLCAGLLLVITEEILPDIVTRIMLIIMAAAEQMRKLRIMKAGCYNYRLIKIYPIYSRAIKTG